MTARTALPANPSPAPERALPVMTRLDEYRIEQVLAHSSLAVVYRAHDTALNLRVAIKEYLPDALALRGAEMQVLTRSKAQAEIFQLGRRAFIEEAQALARCDHPSLVHVTRILQQHGTVYRVMRHCPGPTLLAQRSDCAEAPAAATVHAWLDDLLGALQTLHDAGRVHGAVAPGNILLGPSGQPVLLDFDAVRAALVSDRTQTMMTALEPCFAPIEQREPSAMMPLGPWTDLYSLAATLHFCISGHLPAPPAHDGTAAAFDRLEPVWQRRGARIDGDTARLAAAIDACLVRWPQHRPQSVAAFRALLGEGTPRAAVAATPAAAVTPAAPPPATVAAALTRTDAEPAGPPPARTAATTAAAATVDDRIGAQLIADLDETFARIAAGAHDEATPAAADGVRRERPSVAFAVPPAAQSAGSAVQARIEPRLTTLPPLQPSAATPGDPWAASPAAADVPGESPLIDADSAAAPVPGFMVPPKSGSLRVAAALAVLAFVGIVFALSEWGPVGGGGAAPTIDSATLTAPGGTDRAPIVAATPGPAPVTVTPPSTAAAPAGGVPPTAMAEASVAPQAPPDAVVPPVTAGPAQPAPALEVGAAQPADPVAEPPPKPTPPRPAKVAAAPKAKAPPPPASPREVCGNRTQFSLYQCMQTQCASAKWSAHAQCVRLRWSDSVD